MELLDALGRCTDPEQVSRLLVDAHDMLAAAVLTPAARTRFWERLFLGVSGLYYGIADGPGAELKRLTLAVAQSEIDRYRQE